MLFAISFYDGFGLVFGGLAVLAVVVFVLSRLNRRILPAWLHLGRTKAGEFADLATSIDPAGQMKQAAQDGFDDLKQADKALEACDVLATKIGRQIAADKRTVAIKRGQIATKLSNGVSESDPDIVTLLKDIRDLQSTIAENESQQNIQKTIYKNTLSSANAASKKLKGAMERADRKKVYMDLGAGAERVNDMLAKYDPSSANSRMAAIDRYEQAADDKIDGYASHAKVMADRGFVVHEEEVDVSSDPELQSILAEIKGKDEAACGVSCTSGCSK